MDKRAASITALLAVFFGLLVVHSSEIALAATIVFATITLAGFAVTGQRTAKMWLHPAWLIILGAVPGLLLVQFVSAEHFQANWGSPKFFSNDALILSVLCLASVVLGAIIGGRGAGTAKLGPFDDIRVRNLVASIAKWCLIGTVLGYASWAVLSYARGFGLSTFLAILGGEPGALSDAKRTALAPVAGVTSFVQLGPLAVSAFVLLARIDPDQKTRSQRYIGVLIVLAAARALLYGERLALIEVGVALLVALLLPLTQREIAARTRALLALTPVLIPILLLLVFGTFEYLRSWSSYYSSAEGGSYVDFVIDRVGAYYATASNNSALLLLHDPRTVDFPFFSIAWIWQLPSMAAHYATLSGFDMLNGVQDYLAQRANPEFNNLGGLLAPVFDFGIALGALVWFLVGLALGTVFRRAVDGSVIGQLAYPVLVVGCLEVGRIFYWSQSRAFPQLLVCLILAIAAGHGLYWRRISRAPQPPRVAT